MEHLGTPEKDTASSLYEMLMSDREQFLSRGRKCAELTIPSLLPPSGNSKNDLYVPYQSLGARGVNNLANKLLTSLLPPNTPFFRLLVDDFELAESYDEDGRAKFEEALNSVERSVLTETERKALRTPVFTALKHLIVSGNTLLYLPKKGKARAIKLDSYVVRRSPDGVVLDCILKEEIAYAALPADVRKMLDEQPEDKKYDDNDPVAVYTSWKLDGKRYNGWQEVEGIKVPGSDASWKTDRANFLPLRWVSIDGEDYGRSHVEEYIGDLNALEGLSKSILESSLAAAKTLIFVKPNATTRIDKVASARNLDVLQGQEGDVHTWSLDKRADLSVASSTAQEIKQTLSQAFLLNGSVTRNAERVTAEEIRFMAAELEDSLGGVYSLLSQEFQLPLVNRLMDVMQREGRLPKLPDGIIPSIVTGLEALGRGHDLSRMQVFSNEIAKFGPETVDEFLDLGDYFMRFGTGLGIDMDGLVRSEEDREARAQKKQEQMQQQQMMELAGKAAGPAIAAEAKTQGK